MTGTARWLGIFLAGVVTCACVPSAGGTVAALASTNPAQVCGATTAGPAAPPAGAVSVDPAVDGDLATKTAQNPAGTTFWLAPGTHTLGASPYGQVAPKDGDVYLGAPGAVLDGKQINRYAFTQRAAGVSIKYLTVQGFAPPLNEGVVNHDSGNGWIIEADTIQSNAGAGLMAGAHQVVHGSCLKGNGQYGMNAYQGGNGIVGLDVEGNEIAGNNTGRWDLNQPGCGCFGGVKFWATTTTDVRGNWVHDNLGSPGLWADNNNNDMLIENNLIENNGSEGVFVEQAYNVTIRNNTIRHNAWVVGRAYANRGDPFPIGAVYVSESGGEPRLSGRTAKVEIAGNVFDNNWDGVVAWENADRFCNSPANTGADCTLVLGANQQAKCAQPGIASAPLLSDCRWKTQNLDVHDNTFTFDPATVDGGCPAGFCGRQAVFSNYGSYPDWSPYKGTVVQDAITFGQNNRWHDNTYSGPWRYVAHEATRALTVDQWKAAPYNQDATSPPPPTSSTPPPPPPSSTPPPPPPAPNLLDAPTATVEGGLGKWAPWYSSAPSASTDQAHAGAAGLKVAVTASYGWGVQLSNWPGFPATAGARQVSYWVKAGTGSAGSSVAVTVRFRNASGADLLVAALPSPALSNTWQQVAQSVVAPAGTARVHLSITGGQAAGQVVYFDDFYVG